MSLGLILVAAQAQAATVRVAVASNFYSTLIELASEFEHTHPYQLVISAGSTGKHYAQIKQGAPFDVFLAADSTRPKALLEEWPDKVYQMQTYAIGRLVLWMPSAQSAQQVREALNGSFKRLAIANPRLAPYGLAAHQTLETLSLLKHAEPRLVTGENVAQTYQFVATGNAPLGFVSAAQLSRQAGRTQAQRWLVPRELHQPIEQVAVLLNSSEASRAFFAFLRSEPALQIIHNNGYDTP